MTRDTPIHGLFRFGSGGNRVQLLLTCFTDARTLILQSGR
jgi:hypothetical protein